MIFVLSIRCSASALQSCFARATSWLCQAAMFRLLLASFVTAAWCLWAKLGFGSWDPTPELGQIYTIIESSMKILQGHPMLARNKKRCHRRDSATPFLSSTFGIPSCSTKVAWLNNCLKNDVASDQNDNCVVCLLPHGFVRDMDMDD